MTSIRNRTVAMLAAGAIAAALFAVPATADAKHYKKGYRSGPAVTHSFRGQHRHAFRPIVRSRIVYVRKGPWRIKQRVTVVRLPHRGVVSRKVTVLSKVWVGQRGHWRNRGGLSFGITIN